MNDMTPTDITNILTADEYEVYGLRTLTIVDEADEDRAAPEIASELANSRVWDDGEMTNEELDGTCAFGLSSDMDEAQITAAMKRFAREGYCGNYTVLVGGWSATSGEDNGEIIIKGATVLGVWAAL